MDIHEKSTNLNMGLQSGILRNFGVCVRVGRSAPPTVHTGLRVGLLFTVNMEDPVLAIIMQKQHTN